MANDLNAKVTVGVQGASELQNLTKAVATFRQGITELNPIIKSIDPALAKNATSIGKVLGLYTKAATLASAWAQASIKSAAAAETEGAASRGLATALEQTAAALTKVKGISQASYDAKARTIALETQIAEKARISTEATLNEAKAQNELARAEKARAQTATIGTSAPLTQYQAAILGAKQAAAAAKEKAIADDQAAKAAQQAQAAADAAAAAAAHQAAADRDAAVAAAELARSQALANAAAGAADAAARRNAVALGLQAQAARQAANAAALASGAGVRAQASTAAYNAAIEKQNQGLRGGYFAMYQVAAAYGALSAAAGAVVASTVSVAASFQQAFAQVQRVVGDSSESLTNMSPKLQLLRDQLVELSTVVPTSFEDLSGIAVLAGQLGISGDAVAGFTQTVAQFAALTNVSTQDATLAFGQIDNLLGVTEDKYANLASSIAELGANSAATESQILNVTSAIAASAHQAGFGTEDVLGLATAFASLKISPDLAKGATTRIFAQITRDVSAGGEALAPYAALLHTTTANVEELQRTNPASFFFQLVKGMSDATAAGADLTTITDALGIKNSRDVQVIQRLAGNYSLLGHSVTDAYASFQNSDYLSSRTALIFGTLTNVLTETKNSFRSFLDQVGSSALIPLKGLLVLVGTVIDALKALPTWLTAPIVAIAGLTAAFAAFKAATAVALAGTLAFQSVLGTAGAGAGVNLRTLRTALVDTFGSGAAAATAGGQAVAGAEYEMTAAARIATAEYGRQAAVMEAAALSFNTGSAAGAKLAASQAYAAVAGRANAAQLNSLTAAVAANGSATSVAALRHQLLTASVALEAAAVTEGASAQTVAVNIQAATFYRDAAAKLADAEATGVLATANTAAAGSFRLLNLSGGAWLAIAAGVIAVGVGIYSALHSQSDAAKEAAARVAEYKDRLIAAAGGQEAFAAAVQADTAAFQASGEKATAANGVYEVYGRTLTDLGNRQATVIDAFQNVDPGKGFDKLTAAASAADGTLVGTTKTVGNFSNATEQTKAASDLAATGQAGLAKQVGITNAELERGTVAIGKQTKALLDKAVATQIFGADGKDALISPAERAQLLQSGVQIKDIINAAVKGNPAEINALFQPYIDGLNKKIAALKQVASVSSVDDYGRTTGSNDEAIKAIQDQIDHLHELSASLGGTGSATQEQITNLQDMKNTLEALDPSLADAASGTDDLGKASADAATNMQDLSDVSRNAAPTLDDLAGALGAMIKNAFGVSDAVGGVESSLEALGTSIAANGVDFSNMTEAGRNNLAALQQSVTDYANLQQVQVQNGTVTATEAASNIASFISNTVNELATQGVDTSQLDFLVDYVNQITGTPATWTINADTQQAINNVAQLAQFAAQVQAEINALDAANARNTSDLEQNHPEAVPKAPQAQFADNSNNIAQTIEASRAEQQYAIDLAEAQKQDAAANAAAQQTGQAQKAAANDAKDAGQAQNDAAKERQDAADLASQQEQKHLQYLKDVGDFYANQGSNMFGAANAAGKTADSLAKLGESVKENGKSFSAFSEAGRSNLSAVADALDAYGSTLNDKINNGSLSVEAAGAQFNQFAGGVKQDLLGMGVPLQEINAYFTQIGAGNGWDAASADVQQYRGIAKGAAADTVGLATSLNAAAAKAGLTAEQWTDYLGKVDDYFKSITENAFKFVGAEGDVFASLQSLGQSLVDNGKSFNTLTDAGRKNFDALGEVVSNFETNLTARIDGGIISAQKGAAELASFSGGVYNELIRLGVKAADIAPIMKSLGLNTSGFATGDAAVSQYTGVLTRAEAAAQAAAKGQATLNNALEVTADYASRLADALSAAYDRLHGLSDATDNTTKSAQALAQTHQDNIDKVKELTAANKDLAAGMAQDQLDYDKYNRQYLLAVKYGQKDKAKDLLGQRDAAGASLSGKKDTVAANNKDIEEVQKYGSALTGNSKEAIANRESYEALEKSMLDQIDAYAKTGKSTAQVTAYTEKLKKEFAAAGLQAGYSKKDIATYTKNFDNYASVIRSTPRVVTTKVTIEGADAATNALNSLPKSGAYKTVASADTTAAKRTLGQLPTTGAYHINVNQAGTATIIATLNKIPKRADYVVTAKLGQNAAQLKSAISAKVPSTGGYRATITAAADAVSARHAREVLQNAVGGAIGVAVQAVNSVLGVLGIHVGGGGIDTPSMNVAGTVNAGHLNQRAVWSGGQIGTTISGFSAGGLVPGTPPINPRQDNLLTTGPRGMPVGLRSREYVIPEPAVDYYGVQMFNAIRNRSYPKVTQGFAGGGQAGGGSSYALTSGGYTQDGPVLVQLSTTDRRVLQQIANRPIETSIDGRRLDTVQSNKAAARRRAGVN